MKHLYGIPQIIGPLRPPGGLLKRGAKYLGHICPKCGTQERYVRNTGCVACYRAAGNARYARDPKAVKAQSRAWAVANPDRTKALAGKAQALHRYPHSIPADFDFGATIAVYAEARRLQLETGALYHVDHIVPLCKGGLHVASNLQALNAIENNVKGAVCSD